MIGQIVSHYRIITELGHGGMGTVYEAEDLILQRRVALKFASAEGESALQARERLLREARVSSSLSHTNICTVFDLSEHEGRPFLVLELLQGATLRDLLSSHRLEAAQALDLAIQMADALAAAHACGVSHRDIKPSNVFITKKGRAKLLDFGLARRAITPGSDRSGFDRAVTQAFKSADSVSAGFVGTLRYMAPEQLLGHPTSPRSDVFSFGLVLFEMFAGKHPFLCGSAIETAAAILDAPLKFDQADRSQLAVSTRPILEKCLAKDPANRYADATSLLSDLQRLLPPTEARETMAMPQPRGTIVLAVLPFRNLSADPSQDYFVEGLAEELIHALGKLANIRVAGRASAFRFGGREPDLERIRKQLGVDVVLEGSVQQSSGHLRAIVELVNTADGFHMWSERYDRPIESIFAIQDDIVSAIVAEMRRHFSLRTQSPVTTSSPHNLEAYNLYLRGRFFWNKRTPADLARAARAFEEALQLDASSAAVWTALAECHVLIGVYGAQLPRECFPRAELAANRAIEIDPSQSEAHASLGSIRGIFDWDWLEAEKEFREALAFDPHAGTVHQWFANHCLLPQGRFSEAWNEIENARKRDPLSLAIFASAALLRLLEGKYDEAATECRAALELEAHFPLAHYFLGQALALSGEISEGVSELQRAVTLSGRSVETLSVKARTLAASGNAKEALPLLEELRDRSRREYVSPVLLAQIHAGLGNFEATFKELAEALAARSTDLVWIGVHPFFANVRQMPQFNEIRRALRLPPSFRY
jgi:TolB-like protein/tRNA A-37 threonylcarbamoyl transferase component Bud32/Tfp pilus assembly protein PilF